MHDECEGPQKRQEKQRTRNGRRCVHREENKNTVNPNKRDNHDKKHEFF